MRLHSLQAATTTGEGVSTAAPIVNNNVTSTTWSSSSTYYKYNYNLKSDTGERV